jgi:hypothetical protein
MASLFAEAFKDQMSQETPFTGILKDFKRERDDLLAQMEAERERVRADRAAQDAATRPSGATAGVAPRPTLPSPPPMPQPPADAEKQSDKLKEIIEQLDGLNDTTKGAETAARKSADQLPNLLAVGTKEAAEAILRHETSGDRKGQDRVQRDQLAEQRKANRTLEEIARNNRNAVQLAPANL